MSNDSTLKAQAIAYLIAREKVFKIKAEQRRLEAEEKKALELREATRNAVGFTMKDLGKCVLIGDQVVTLEDRTRGHVVEVKRVVK